MNKLLSLLTAVLILGLSSTSALAVELVLSHQWFTDDMRHKVAQLFADEVNKSDVDLTVKIYPYQSILKAHEQYLPLSRGQLDLTILPLHYAKELHAEYDFAQMPGLVKNYDHASRLVESEFMVEIEKLMANDDIKVLAHGFISGGIAGTNKCITKPADVSGLHVQTASSTAAEMLAVAGATIAPVSPSGIYRAMQSGELEAANDSWISLVSKHAFEQAKCYTSANDYGLWFSYQPILMNNSTYNSLSVEQKNVLNKAAKSAEDNYLKMAKREAIASVKHYTNADVEVVEMSRDDYNQWMELAKQSSYKKFSDEVPNGQALLNMALSVE